MAIGLFDADHFKTKNASMSRLYDKNDPRRKAICEKEKYADTMLNKISLCLETNRNFMMHSDDSRITKIESQTKADEKLDTILGDTKEIFDYFNTDYGLI